jgi:hypothetical protein
MTERTAECSCGRLTIRTHDEPVRVSVCHCFSCQRRTGSAFGVQAWFRIDKVEVSGDSSEYVRTGDSGSQIPFRFCPSCGSTMSWQLADRPDLIAVPVGAFSDSSFPTPEVSVYDNSRRHRWVRLPEGIKCIG